MKLWVRIKKLSLPSLLGFGWILIRRPHLIFPVYQVTQRTMQICNERFGKAHFNAGKANAFRHALWNYLLCRKVNGIINNPIHSALFTERLVNYYEKVTRNEVMDRRMDDHNNAIGRNIFLSNLDENEEKMIDFMQNEAKNAQKVSQIEGFSNMGNKLVYLKEDV